MEIIRNCLCYNTLKRRTCNQMEPAKLCYVDDVSSISEVSLSLGMSLYTDIFNVGVSKHKFFRFILLHTIKYQNTEQHIKIILSQLIKIM